MSTMRINCSFFSQQFTLKDWEGLLSIPVPLSHKNITGPPPDSSGSRNSRSKEDTYWLYGTGLAVVILASAILVVIIMLLKYIQMTRRDTDKGEGEGEGGGGRERKGGQVR